MTTTLDPIDASDAEDPDGFLPDGANSHRRSAARSLLTFVSTVCLALVGAIPVLFLAGSNPATAYHALLQGSLGSKSAIAETIIAATPLLLSGLAVAVGFQTGLFNIGVEGQLVAGALAAGVIGQRLSLPGGLEVVVAMLGGAIGGAAWALVPGLLKAYKGVHEVITTIMFNYVAFSLSHYLVGTGGLLTSTTQPLATDPIRPSAQLPRIWAPTRLHAGILIAAALTVATWYFLYRTPAGFRFRVVGSNSTAALFNGINPRRVTIQAMLLSGAFGGLAGAVEVLGLYHRYLDSFSPGYGFDSIAVALLGMLNPLGVAAAALFFGILRGGSTLLQAQAGVSPDMISVISGLVIAVVAARPVIDRSLERRRRSSTPNVGRRRSPSS